MKAEVRIIITRRTNEGKLHVTQGVIDKLMLDLAHDRSSALDAVYQAALDQYEQAKHFPYQGKTEKFVKFPNEGE